MKLDMVPSLFDIEQHLAALNDWEDRYRFLVGIGRALPALAPDERTEANRISRCVSQVWLVSELQDGADQSIVYRGDSDTQIVKGLLAVMLAIYSGRPAADILDTDVSSILQRMGLQNHLSAQRADGLRAMIARFRADAIAAR